MANLDPQNLDNRFVRSVNLEYDINDERSAQGYVLTSVTRRFITAIAAARQNASGSRVYTLTGPYGTGKSALCTFAAQLYGPSTQPGRATARQVLREQDEDLYNQLFDGKGSRTALVPVVATASREPISFCLLRAFASALDGIKGRRAIELRKQIESLLQTSETEDTPTAAVVISCFEQLEEVLCQGSSAVKGVLLFLDEMGKLLEFAADQPSRSDVYLLQMMAEYVARRPRPTMFIGVLHQDFAGYAQRLTSTERAEWEKIRGRFDDILVDHSTYELILLVARAVGSVMDRQRDAGKLPSGHKKICDQAQNQGLLPTTISKRESTAIFQECWPLHPIVAALVGPLFRRIGQNERSVFSFLQSSEPYAFQSQVNEGAINEPYRLDMLYDYLHTAFGSGLYLQMHGKRWVEISEALERLANHDNCEVSVAKTIGVLHATRHAHNILPTEELIQYALSPTFTHGEVTKSLRSLVDRRIVIFRGYNNTYALWEGSDIDVEEHVKAARGKVADLSDVIDVINSNHRLRPIVARKHLFQSGTLRYFDVRCTTSDTLQQHLMTEPDCDGALLVVLPRNDVTQDEIMEMSASGKDNYVLTVVDDTHELEAAARELAAIDWVRRNTAALEGDSTARRELVARRVDMQRRLDNALEQVLHPAAHSGPICYWVARGKPLAVKSARDIHDCISAICSTRFGESPSIRNELINRNQLSTSAARGRNKLIAAMVEHGDTEGLSIEKTPPEKSMYLSMLLESGIHRQSQNGWIFGTPTRKDLLHVWDRMDAFFQDSQDGLHKVSELFEILGKPPFGLRDGPIPVLFTAALLANEEDVALYDNGALIPQLSSAHFERLVKSPDEFAIRRWRVEGPRAVVFREMAQLLGKTELLKSVRSRDLLDVVRPLYNFFRSLPEYTTKTRDLTDRASKVRNALASASEPDQLLFHELPQACGFEPFESSGNEVTDRSHDFLNALRSALGELQQAYDRLVERLGLAVGEAFGAGDTLSAIRETVTERARLVKPWVADTALIAFINRVDDDSLDDTQWVESVAGLLSERPPYMWTDRHQATFDVELRRIARLVSHVEAIATAEGATRNPGKGHLAYRIGIASNGSPEREQVIHLTGKNAKLAAEMSRKIREEFIGRTKTADRRILVAAFAQLTQELLASYDDQKSN